MWYSAELPTLLLLFAIAIEQLAVALRFSQMMGIKRGGSVYKLSLYADDLLLFFSDPDRSIFIPQVLVLLEEFGHVSSYKLNIHKHELMLLPLPILFQNCLLRHH